FGFFYSTWGINFTLLENAEDNKDAKDGLYGKYAVCEGPQNYYWGGTWICCSAGSDNTDIVADIMKQLTVDQDTMVNITKDTQDYTNNVAGMDELAKDFASDFLGGQNHIALFAKTAPGIDMSNAGAYDQGLNESFQGAMKDYFTGAVPTKEDAINNFYKAAIEKHPNLKIPGSK
ncbi:MAG: carbohydrate ABC transporter substrate-binding protein, partial [Clostridiales bacterium]|nr:carbohydrate ABC transporter substrate-binding protein [Clostridiales bacterium]